MAFTTHFPLISHTGHLLSFQNHLGSEFHRNRATQKRGGCDNWAKLRAKENKPKTKPAEPIDCTSLLVPAAEACKRAWRVSPLRSPHEPPEIDKLLFSKSTKWENRMEISSLVKNNVRCLTRQRQRGLYHKRFPLGRTVID